MDIWEKNWTLLLLLRIKGVGLDDLWSGGRGTRGIGGEGWLMGFVGR